MAIILIDQDLRPDSGLDILARVRRNAPYAAIILQTNQSDSQTAIQALQNGADFLLLRIRPDLSQSCSSLFKKPLKNASSK